jgi:hypothetical protein
MTSWLLVFLTQAILAAKGNQQTRIPDLGGAASELALVAKIIRK